ncbi:hypothetical protein KC717_06920 [Candidatus Dojkabacteria bacterium]|uniref:SGNH hydrolase-type esterase domain-containing protein n=1 Tax=Candidatus Dojkabacteria bacterium TaxID=2099670 RepID=A0A955L967_9BACT|nr:hypothetical protein [Candidatus Dojkabacteria bacterium]
MQLFIFGDSIAFGFYSSYGGGWVQKIQNKFTPLYPGEESLHVFNLSISGENTLGVLERFDREFSSRAFEDHDHTIIFAIGINDSVLNTSNSKPVTPINDFDKNYQTLINRARNYSEKILLLGLTPVDTSILSPIPWAPELSMSNQSTREFDTAIQMIAKRNDVSYLDLFNVIAEGEHSDFFLDGLHPNDEGHKIIADHVSEFLITNNWILCS